MARMVALVMALVLLATEGAAAPLSVTRETQTDVMLTIYNGNLGLVKDVREVRLPAGTSEVQFGDVAAQIDPTSVHLKSLSDPAGLRVLEQNYEYDLLSSDKLMEKYVGRTVRLYQGDGTYHDAKLLSTAGPVFEINGQIHLGWSGRMVLPALPDNLVVRPTLVWLLRNRATPAPGDGAIPVQRIEAAYLTGGLGWKADYVVVLGADDTSGDVTGWVTIDNKSGATYGNTALKLVAGDVHRADQRARAGRALEVAATSAAAADRDFVAESLFEYHLYTLDGRTTLKDNQTKQLALMSATGVSVKKELIYHGAADSHRTAHGVPMSNQKVAVMLELRNSTDNRLGSPLPRGKVRVYKADTSGSRQFIGEDWIDHTPKDERVRIKLGDAFDVVGQRTQKAWRKIASNLYEVEWEIALRNHKAQAQTVTVIEPVPGDWQVLHSSLPYEVPEAHTLRFEVVVPQDGTTRLVYRVRLAW